MKKLFNLIILFILLSSTLVNAGVSTVPNDILDLYYDGAGYVASFDYQSDGDCICDDSNWGQFKWSNNTCYPNTLCTNPSTPYSCCTGNGVGTCSDNDCIDVDDPFDCCTEPGKGTCEDFWPCDGGSCESYFAFDVGTGTGVYYGYGQVGLSATPGSVHMYHHDDEQLAGYVSDNQERTESKLMNPAESDHWSFWSTGSLDFWLGFVWYVPNQTFPSDSGTSIANMLQFVSPGGNTTSQGSSFSLNWKPYSGTTKLSVQTQNTADSTTCLGSDWQDPSTTPRWCHVDLGTPSTALNLGNGSDWTTISKWNHILIHVKEGVNETGIAELYINGVKVVDSKNTSCDAGAMDNAGCIGEHYDQAGSNPWLSTLQWGLYGYYDVDNDYQDWRDELRIYVGTGGSYAEIIPPIWPADPTNTYPAADATGIDPTSITFTSSAYAESPDYDIGVYDQYAGRWRVYESSSDCSNETGNCANCYKDSGWDADSKTSHTFLNFANTTDYWWTVEHRNVVDASGSEGDRYYDSNPSSCTKFTTTTGSGGGRLWDYGDTDLWGYGNVTWVDQIDSQSAGDYSPYDDEFDDNDTGTGDWWTFNGCYWWGSCSSSGTQSETSQKRNLSPTQYNWYTGDTDENMRVNALHQPVSGAFDVYTLVDPTPADNYDAGGLMFTDGTTSNSYAIKWVWDGSIQVEIHCRNESSNAVYTGGNINCSGTGYCDASSLYLRLKRDSSGNFQFFYGENPSGDQWREITAASGSPNSGCLDFDTTNDGTIAIFAEDFTDSSPETMSFDFFKKCDATCQSW